MYLAYHENISTKGSQSWCFHYLLLPWQGKCPHYTFSDGWAPQLV